MRILILGINYTPELTGIGKYTGEMAAWLAQQGHEVKVVTAPPYYPAWQVGAGYSARRYQREIIDGVTVWRCPLWVPGKVSGLKRIAHLLSFSFTSLWPMLAQVLWRPQVVMVIEPPLVCAPQALLVARLSGAQAWLHVQDFEVDAAFALGILKPGISRTIAQAIESWLMRRFDRLSSISLAMCDRFTGKGADPDRVALFPNWVDTDVITARQNRPDLAAELGVPAGRIICLYAGNMGEKQGLELLVEAAERAQADPRIHFLLCGDGAARARLERQTAGLGNVSMAPLQPLERLNDLLACAHIHLLPQRADVGELVMPSKLTGMLASGRPVIATALPDSLVAIAISNCGLVTPPGDAAEFLSAIQTLADDPGRRAELGKIARKIAVNDMSKNAVLSRTFGHLTECQ